MKLSMRWVMVWVALALCAGVGCSSKDDGADGSGRPDGGAGPSAGDAAADGGGDAGSALAPGDGPGSRDTTESAIDKDCRGFSFDDLVYSPGGSTLPNTCEPFDPTTNNPYAVRCVDVWPWFKTIYPGDNYCILPPSPDKGVQFGVHPQGAKWFAQVSTGDMSGYDKPTDEFVMQDGEEEERNYHTSATNEAENNYYRSYARMRGGSHHMINNTAAAGGMLEYWGPGSPDGLRMGVSLPGAQRPDENTPKTLDKPTEDKGLYEVFPAAPGVTFNMHHFNLSGKPILKEAWINLWWEDDATVQVHPLSGLDYIQVATLNVAPGATQDLHYKWDITQEIRVLTLFGHRHAWTTNFTSWVETPGKDPEIIYQSFDWFDEPTYRYDSMAENPKPAAVGTVADGGKAGVLTLNPGDQLHFNCHIEFTDERATAVKSPQTPTEIGPLRFANQAFTAEMCILFGSTAAVRMGAPTRLTTPPPDFATAD